MRRKDREVLDDTKIDCIIKNSKVCRLGFYDNGEIYIVPLNFGFVHHGSKRIFYFHSAKEGRKIDIMKRCAKVAFELDTVFEIVEAELACNFSATYQSVIGTGTIYEVTNDEDKKIALMELMNTVVGEKEWLLNEKMMDLVAIFRLEVEKISCKEHKVL